MSRVPQKNHQGELSIARTVKYRDVPKVRVMGCWVRLQTEHEFSEWHRHQFCIDQMKEQMKEGERDIDVLIHGRRMTLDDIYK